MLRTWGFRKPLKSAFIEAQGGPKWGLTYFPILYNFILWE